MASSRPSNGTSASKTQQKPDWLTGAAAPAPTPPSGGSSLTREHGSFGGPSHLSHMTPTAECHQEPVQGPFFIRDGQDARPLERAPHNHEVAVVTARPSTPVHRRRQPEPEHAGGAGAPRRRRIKSPVVNHTAENKRLIQLLDPHLRSIVRSHFGNSKELQEYALKRILQGPICHVETNDGDRKGAITCTLCPSNPTPQVFLQANAIRKFALHFRTVHCEISHSFKCIAPSCEKVFSQRHDMVRHFKAAHPDSDLSTGEAQGSTPDPVAASNTAGPSSSHAVGYLPSSLTGNLTFPPSHVPTSVSSKLAKGSGPPRKITNVPDLGSSASKPSRQVNPHRQRNVASSHLGHRQHTTRDINLPDQFPSAIRDPNMTDDDGSGRGYAGPSTSFQVEYAMSGNQSWANRSLSSNRSSMPQEEQYGGLSHSSVLAANDSTTYLHSYDQMISLPSSSQSSGVPGGFPGGAQSRQDTHSAIVSQVVNPDYTMNRMVTGVPDSLAQFHSNFMPTEGSHQSAHFPTVTGALTRWQDNDGASMSAHYGQYQHGQDGHNGITDPGQGMSRHYSGPTNMQPVRGGSTRPTLPQYHHTGTTPQRRYIPQDQRDDILNHGQQATPPSWRHPQDPMDTTLRSTSRMPSQSQGYSGHYGQTPTGNAKDPGHLGDRVSQNQRTLKRAVGRSLSSRLGLIRHMVGLSGASQSAIPVSLAPPWERKRLSLLFLIWEGEVHNIDLWTWAWALRKWQLCGLLTAVC